MTKSEIVDIVIESFIIGALLYNISMMAYHFLRQRKHVCHYGPITSSNIEARDILRKKLQCHGILVCSITLLSLYMYFSISWFWFLTLSLLGSFLIHNWLTNIFGPIVEYTNLPQIQKFGIYLRSFAADNDKEKHCIEIELVKRFSSICRLFSIGNPHEVFNIKSSTAIYATDENWKHVISEMASKSYYIVLRVHKSEGTMWELETCFKNDYENKTIFILDDEDGLKLLNKSLSEKYHVEIKSPNDNEYPCAVPLIYYDVKSASIIPLTKRSDIKKMFDFCSSLNDTLKNEHLHYRNNRSYILSRMFDKNFIPKGVGWFDWGFIVNPYMYVLYNRWPLWIVITPLLTEGLALFVNKYFLYSAPWVPFATMLLWIYCISLFILITLFPKRISWLSRNWPSVEFFNYENAIIRKSMTMMILSICWYWFWISVIIHFFTGWWMQLK